MVKHIVGTALEQPLDVPFLFAQPAFNANVSVPPEALLGRRSEQRGFSDVIREEEHYETQAQSLPGRT